MLFCLSHFWIRILAALLLIYIFLSDCLLIVVWLFPLQGISDAIDSDSSNGLSPDTGIGCNWVVYLFYLNIRQNYKYHVKQRIVLGLYVFLAGVICNFYFHLILQKVYWHFSLYRVVAIILMLISKC
ncbi:hypothetical protein BHC44_02710 [Snodgrassella alvi]|nr:hypothetical protein BHC44_02710 [Snodgrassella alvi]